MRLDFYLVQKGMCQSRDRAKALIVEGECTVNGVMVKKPAFKVGPDDVVSLQKEDFSYVGRGGLKLEEALGAFGIDVLGMVALDTGAATGGFTDCLLQYGVKKVYALDIGKGQLAPQLQKDDRVVYMPHTDAREMQLPDFLDPLDLVVVDVSFISVTSILDALKRVSHPKTEFIILIKPQFETGKPHSGVLRDPTLIQNTLENVRKAFQKAGFSIVQEIPSPVLGKEGNREFLWHARLT